MSKGSGRGPSTLGEVWSIDDFQLVLRQVMAERGVNGPKVAKAIGLSPITVKCILNGSRRILDLETVVRLCRWMEYKIDFFCK